MTRSGTMQRQQTHARAWHAARDACLYSRAAQRLDELCAVLELVAVALDEPAVIVEIGAGTGGTLAAWQRMFPASARFGVDLVVPLATVAGSTVLDGDSHDAATLLRLRDQLAGRPADVLFLDGDKSPDGIARDWEMYVPLVRPGGLILIGGVANPDEGDMADWWARTKAETARAGDTCTEIVTQAGPPIGFGIVRTAGGR